MLSAKRSFPTRVLMTQPYAPANCFSVCARLVSFCVMKSTASNSRKIFQSPSIDVHLVLP